MATNKYFNHYPKNRTNEQRLIEELLTESIQIFGHDCYFIPRESIATQDLIFGEDPTAQFNKAYLIDMYIATGNEVGGHYAGMNDVFSKFGVEIRDDSNFICSIRTFKKYVPSNVRIKPNEGDLIWVPIQRKMYEIRFVEPDMLFFQLGKEDEYLFEMRCESFRYSNEPINTGIDDIDMTMENNSFTIQLQLLANGLRDFHIGEDVYVGSTYATANATATVNDWDPSELTITLVNTKGEFVANSVIKGVTSNAIHTIGTTDDMGDYTVNDSKDNKDIQLQANNIIDTTETNPFGMP